MNILKTTQKSKNHPTHTRFQNPYPLYIHTHTIWTTSPLIQILLIKYFKILTKLPSPPLLFASSCTIVGEIGVTVITEKSWHRSLAWSELDNGPRSHGWFTVRSMFFAVGTGRCLWVLCVVPLLSFVLLPLSRERGVNVWGVGRCRRDRWTDGCQHRNSRNLSMLI